jgi:hypothetical protein
MHKIVFRQKDRVFTCIKKALRFLHLSPHSADGQGSVFPNKDALFDCCEKKITIKIQTHFVFSPGINHGKQPKCIVLFIALYDPNQLIDGFKID